MMMIAISLRFTRLEKVGIARKMFQKKSWKSSLLLPKLFWNFAGDLPEKFWKRSRDLPEKK
jgi:hypothetical protein